jgi:hypothetical protein
MGLNILGATVLFNTQAGGCPAESAGQVLYQYDGGKEPVPARFTPPIPLAKDQGVTWSCSYLNDGPAPLTFGESAVTNEMCVFGAIYYPVEDVNFPNIPCF